MFHVGASVRVAKAINYGAGTSHWDGRIGTVKTARKRSCDVLLEGETEPLWFFHRELVIMETE